MNVFQVPMQRCIALACGLAMATTAIGVSIPRANAAGQAIPTALTIDASQTIRPVTHVASGGLYALKDESTPSASILQPLHLHQLTQPTVGVQQISNGASVPAGDTLKVNKTMVSAGAQETMRMADIYPDWPYNKDETSIADWLSKVDQMMTQRLASKTATNINGYELFNEPDNTWNATGMGVPFYTTSNSAAEQSGGWTQTYREVKKYDADTAIVGPSTSNFNADRMRGFLQAAKDTDTLPDVISWHEWKVDSIPSEVQQLDSIEDSLGISRRQISINESEWMDEVDVPSTTVHYISTFEKQTEIRDAERPFWYESGTVNGLLYEGKPTGMYWLYKWYGDMAGNMLKTTQTTVGKSHEDGFASLDSSTKTLNAVVGGASGSNNIHVTNLSGFGSNASVTLKYTPESGRAGVVSTPTTLWTKTTPITNGALDVPITDQNQGGAYQILVQPASESSTYQQVYEAENATVVNGSIVASDKASNGAYVGNLSGDGKQTTDSFVDFLVNAPMSGKYKLSISYANPGSDISTLGMASDGGAWTTLSFPSTGSQTSFSTLDAGDVTLNNGYGIIRLAKGSPYLSAKTGTTNIDSIKLVSESPVPSPAKPQPASFATRVEAEKSKIVDAQSESGSGASNGGYVGMINNADSSVSFTVENVPSAGTYNLAVGYDNNTQLSASTVNPAITNDPTVSGTSDMYLKVNDLSKGSLIMPATGNWSDFTTSVTQSVDLHPGSNTITLTKGKWGYAQLDYIDVYTGGNVSLPASQTVSITAPDKLSITSSGATVGGTASSGLPVALSVSGSCTLKGKNVVVPTAVGKCVLRATQSGDGMYSPANAEHIITIVDQGGGGGQNNADSGPQAPASQPSKNSLATTGANIMMVVITLAIAAGSAIFIIAMKKRKSL